MNLKQIFAIALAAALGICRLAAGSLTVAEEPHATELGAKEASPEESRIAKALQKTKILKGNKLKAHEIEGDPEFFILYYSASW